MRDLGLLLLCLTLFSLSVYSLVSGLFLYTHGYWPFWPLSKFNRE